MSTLQDTTKRNLWWFHQFQDEKKKKRRSWLYWKLTRTFSHNKSEWCERVSQIFLCFLLTLALHALAEESHKQFATMHANGGSLVVVKNKRMRHLHASVQCSVDPRWPAAPWREARAIRRFRADRSERWRRRADAAEAGRRGRCRHCCRWLIYGQLRVLAVVGVGCTRAISVQGMRRSVCWQSTTLLVLDARTVVRYFVRTALVVIVATACRSKVIKKSGFRG